MFSFAAVALLAMGANWGLALPIERGESAASASPRHVLVVSVDGLGASWLTHPPPNLHIPNFKRLMEEGSYAEGVWSVYPSLTYPAHTTMVTGRMPAEHGIYSNLSSREAGKNSKDWFWFSNAIKVPTLWDLARQNNLTTSSVFWSVTVGGPINWNIPEIWDPAKGMAGDPLYVAKFATPGLLFEAALELGPPQGASDDVMKVKLTGFVLKKHQPNLLMLHLAELDGALHQRGPASPEAAAAVEKADERIGELLTAVKAAGLENKTDVFIVSDHGFLSVERSISPNVLLARAGLITADENGNVTGGKVFTMADGGSFFISWPESQNLRADVEAAIHPLRDEGALYGELGREALKDLGAEPAAQIALEAPSAASFDSKASGEVIQKLPQTTGTHGHLPFRPGLAASFIAWGPHIKKGGALGHIPMTAIGPTLLKALGIEKGQLGPHPPLDQIFK
ncbi:MAG: alkaline phosphatase family protein [Acidobacteria bacterium]|nr:alkaline phosphatase family protein [Acidobacteriota bacterium]